MKVRHWGLLLVAALAAASCSSGSDSATTDDVEVTPSSTSAASAEADDEPGDDEPADGAFDGAVLAAADAAPFEAVRLEGVEAVTGLFALFDLADGATWATPVLIDDDGSFVLAPPYTDDPYAGGAVDLRLTDGSDVGESLTLTVSALPRADLTIADMIDQVRASIDADAALLGSSWDELVGTSAADVRPDLLPLKIAQVLLDDGTESSVVSLLASLDDDAATLIGDLLAAAGYAESREAAALADLIAAAEADLDGPVVSGFAAAGRSRPLPSGPVGVAAPTYGGADCIPVDVEPDLSAARLSELMTKSALGAIASSDQTLAGKYLAGAEMAMGLAAALETAGTGGKTELAGTLATFITAEKMLQAMNAGIMPSSFTNIDVTLDPGELEEDRVEPGTWTEVWVTARSTGYSLDADIAGAAIDAIGGAVVGKAGIEEGSLLEHEAAATVGEVKGAVTGMLPQEGVITFCPSTWRVDIAGEDYSWARPVSGLLTVDNQALTYVNEKEIGVETLRFAPLPEKFGGRTIVGDIQVPTEAIDVKVTASKYEITTPGETVQITAEIDHAVVETLAWFPGTGQWSDGIGADTNGPTTRPLTTPTDPSKYPVRVEVESTSRQGLRATSADRRYDFLEIELAPIIVLPNPGSVEVRKTLPFTATDRDGDPVAVNWTATGGTIAGTGQGAGLYTAGDEEGQYEVTATLSSNSQVSATVPVNVGEFCLSGTWRINQAEFARLMSQGDVTVTPAGGTWDITVDSDGSFTSTLTGFAFQMSGEGAAIKVTLFGSQTGSVSYTATEITAVTTDSYELSAVAEVGGQTIAMSPDDLPLGTEFGGGPYRCEDGQLIVDRDGLDVLYDKVG